MLLAGAVVLISVGAGLPTWVAVRLCVPTVLKVIGTVVVPPSVPFRVTLGSGLGVAAASEVLKARVPAKLVIGLPKPSCATTFALTLDPAQASGPAGKVTARTAAPAITFTTP